MKPPANEGGKGNMGEKDITQKNLEDYNDVFADIVNVLVFKGKRHIRPRDLFSIGTKSQYKADDGKIHEQERDNSKEWRKERIAFCVFGIENQAKYEKYMPLRVYGYEGASYRSQVLGEPPYKVHQVVTIILNFGNTRWKESSKHLKNVVKIMPELEEYTNDIKINVFDIAWLDEETVNMFQSDFSVVADFFVQTRKNKTYIPSKQKLKHVDAVLKLLSIFAGAKEYESLLKSGAAKGVKTMCEATRKIKEEGREEGREITYYEMIQKGRVTVEEAAEELGIDIEKVKVRMAELGYMV